MVFELNAFFILQRAVKINKEYVTETMCGPRCLKYLHAGHSQRKFANPCPGILGCDFSFTIAQISRDHFMVTLPAVPLLPHFIPGGWLSSGFTLLSNQIMLLEVPGPVSSGDECRDVQR